jgi:hypothetical protein
MWQSTVRPFLCLAYDCRHNIVLTLENDQKVRSYLPHPLPTILAAPTTVPDSSSVSRLLATKVQTRLTGAQGEPCSGYAIHWRVTGTGKLWREVTLTDQDGYGVNYFYGPKLLGNPETIAVRVIV